MKVAENAAGRPEDFLVPEPPTVDAVLDVLGLVRDGAEGGPRPREDGLAYSVAVCTAVLTDVRDRLTDGGSVADPEFVAVLAVELAKRYLRAVRNDALGGRSPDRGKYCSNGAATPRSRRCGSRWPASTPTSTTIWPLRW